MTTRLRPIEPGDRAEVEALLAQAPIENLFLAAKVAAVGVSRRGLGRLLGFERESRLSAVCLCSGAVFPTGGDPAALPAFVEAIGPVRNASSILGPSMAALGLFTGLAERWPGAWGQISNVRKQQPLMVLASDPLAEGDARVRQLGKAEFDSYLSASEQMYTEEIGSSPYKHGPGYEFFVRDRLKRGEAYGIVEQGEVIFKADLGPRLGNQAQLQGVWLHPKLRGKGYSPPALASVLRLLRKQFPVVSLYVNDFNIPAIRSYQRLGFQQVGTLSTVHY